MNVQHGYKAVVLADKYNITADGTDFTVSVDHPVADVTGFGNTAKSFVSGQYSWKGDYKGWFNNRGGTAGAENALLDLEGNDQTLGTAGTSVPGSHLWGFFPEGIGTAKYGYCGPATMNGAVRTIPIGAAVAIQCGVVGTANLGRAFVLNGGTAVLANGTSAVWDNSSVSAVGGCAYLWSVGEVTAPFGTVTVQHSTDDTTYADLCVLGTVDIGNGTAKWAVVAKGDTINRYIRAVWGRATTNNPSGTAVIAFARF